MKIEKQNDRVTVSLGRKISITRYENMDVFISYARDREPGEMPEKAVRQTEAMVMLEFNRLVRMVEKGEVEGAKPGGKLYD